VQSPIRGTARRFARKPVIDHVASALAMCAVTSQRAARLAGERRAQ
jgi:hypothetical protein